MQTATDVSKKKMPRWLKLFYIVGMAILALIAMPVVLVSLLAEKPEITSWDQWIKHRDYLKSFSGNVMIHRNATQIYLRANDYYKDGFYSRCDLDACAEYKAFIRAARDASADGILTPKELEEVAQYQVRLQAIIQERDREFRGKFKE